jgi:hypothetical protein
MVVDGAGGAQKVEVDRAASELRNHVKRAASETEAKLLK